MGQVVLLLDDVHDKKLRKLAAKEFKNKKGSMSKIVSRGIDLVEEKMKRDYYFKKLMYLAENAKDLGIGTFKRDEAYER